MSETEIGRGKRARVGYSFDDISVVPSRRTRDAADVSISWQFDASLLDIPIMAAPMDSVTSPWTAIKMGELGGVGVLDLEGVWTRYEDPTPIFEQIAREPAESATALMQKLYREPIKSELIQERLNEIRESGQIVAGALSPQRTQEHWRTVVNAGVDLFVIRGTTVSAEHVSSNREPLNLKRFIYELDVPVVVGGAASYTAALHLMRTGAAGVLAGFGGGATTANRRTVGVAVPMATTVADVAAARREYMDETGGRYVHVIADGQVSTSGDLVKAIACGADGVMLGTALARSSEAPGRGYHWGAEVYHKDLPRGERVEVGTVASLETIINGPSNSADGLTNFTGALRHAMAMTGYSDLKEFQRVLVSVGM
ncbi:IMP dehydrogenase [Trueperella bonasi]|uniref:IMP dehydrogenase n=1 Tax=Trueperella bonasi TaxID=312286 RepID=A0ABT9NEP3_9ACTO|nr:GuaB3 family IMP dehydrogenase-related protein [Trueperella bonasi]MDP9805840.1 IMP dehydrogenase [Trueperella bonasi]